VTVTDGTSNPLPGDDAERPFPSEAEWLTLPLPDDAARSGLPSQGFVDRVTDAVCADRRLDDDLAQQSLALPRDLLDAHDSPPPSHGFVDRTLAALRDDRHARWQRLLARHVSPEPSPFFVARTLAALQHEREERAPHAILWPRLAAAAMLAAAAVVAIALALRTDDDGPSTEQRLALATAPAFAHAAAANPLATLVALRNAGRDPEELPNVGADGVWLLREVTR